MKRKTATGQWSEARMDLALEPGKPMDEALAASWLRQAGIAPAARFRADGTLTRGEFLERMYQALKKE